MAAPPASPRGEARGSATTASVVAIGLFYGAGLFYGERTHLTVMECWRCWIVHPWVEGFFEAFATTALGFTLLVLRYIRPHYRLHQALVKTAFRGLNAGLALIMALQVVTGLVGGRPRPR